MWEDLGPQLWPAFWVTIKLTFFSAIGATIWGTILAGMRVSPVPAMRVFGTWYVNIVRNTPLTLIILFLSLGLDPIVAWLERRKLPRWAAVLITILAVLAAFAGIILFMVVVYGFFGMITSFALFMNMVLLIALMSLLGATLTMPGVAGLVLSLGMAVDANVLIYERIREELRLARWSGETSWDALERLAGRTRVPELKEVADIIRLANDSGASVSDNLLARAASMRDRLLTREQTAANAATSSMGIPLAALAVLFLIAMLVPAAMQLSPG